jgi:hypothetical protein
MSEFELPKSSPPRFALAGHEWSPINWMNHGETIRILGEWRLHRRIVFVPKAAKAKSELQNPNQTIPNWVPKQWRTKRFKDAMIAGDILRNLATVVQRGISERQSIKKTKGIKKRWLKSQSYVTSNEIQDALRSLHYLAKLGCSSLMEIAKVNPELVQPTARKEVSWPLMMSRHPGYSVKHIKFLESLKQGDDAYYDIHQISRDGTQRMAVEKGTREIAKRLYLCLLVEWEQTQEKLNGKQVAPFCDDKKISSAWWKVAESRLLEAYPQPHEIPELARIAAPSRKYPSDKNADIRRRLKAAFLGLAKNQDELAKLANRPVVKNASNTLTP